MGKVIIPTDKQKKDHERVRTTGYEGLASTDDFSPYNIFGLRKKAVCDRAAALMSLLISSLFPPPFSKRLRSSDF